MGCSSIMQSVEGITMLVVCNMCLILTVSSIVSIPLLHVVMVEGGEGVSQMLTFAHKGGDSK